MAFPKAIATAQREAITNDLREVRASLGATLAALKASDFQPHLIGIDQIQYRLLTGHLKEAEAAVSAAVDALQP